MGNYSRYWDQRVHQISAQHMQVHMLGLRRRLNHVKGPEMSWGYGTKERKLQCSTAFRESGMEAPDPQVPGSRHVSMSCCTAALIPPLQQNALPIGP